MTLKELAGIVANWIGETASIVYSTEISVMLTFAYLVAVVAAMSEVGVPLMGRWGNQCRSWPSKWQDRRYRDLWCRKLFNSALGGAGSLAILFAFIGVAFGLLWVMGDIYMALIVA